MKEIFKKFKINYSVSAVLCVILGMSLIIKPDGLLINYLLGGACIAAGVCYIFSYIFSQKKKTAFSIDFSIGLVMSAIGTFIIVKPGVFSEIILTILGIVILFHGFVNIQQAFNLKMIGTKRWWVELILAIITAILGILTVIYSGEVETFIKILIGIFLVVDGLFSLWIVFSLIRNVKIYDASAVIETQAVDVTKDE